MIVWIDATRSQDTERVFGMTLLERLLRGLVDAGVHPFEVRIELPPGGRPPPSLPGELVSALPIKWSRDEAPLGERFDRALREAGGKALLALAADTVVDTRLIAHLAAASGSLAFRAGEGDERCAVLRLEAPLAESPASAADLAILADHAVRTGVAADLDLGDFELYVRKLRRELAPYLFRIPDAARRKRVEKFLFHSNYKGSTDFLTKYVYPPLVWQMVRPLARRRVHPNWVTAGSYVCTFASIPFFMAGAWLPGIALAYTMSVLDSVDGKLARLTYRSSRFGDIFDHGLDMVHPPFWYLAWGWALGGGDAGSGPFVASLWLLGFYVLDRLCAPIFKRRTGRSIHGYTPLDARMRTFISRRNVNLAAFTVAVAVDAAVGGQRVAVTTFYAIVVWQVVSLVWHAARVVEFWNARAPR